MKALKQYFEGMFIEDIHEGLFDADDSLEEINQEVLTTTELEKLGLTKAVCVDGVWHCCASKTYILSNPKFKKCPKNIEALAISGADVVIDGDVKNSNIKKLWTSHNLVIKAPKIDGIEFSGDTLDYYGKPRPGFLDIVIKNDSSDISNCRFYDLDFLTIKSTQSKFKNCEFYAKENIAIQILFDGTAEECSEWISNICNCELTVDMKRYGAKKSYEVPFDLPLRVLRNYGIEPRDYNNVYVRIACTKEDENYISMSYGGSYSSSGWSNDKIIARSIKRSMR